MRYPLYKARPPYMRVSEGFGYLGVLMYDNQINTIQCHLCGKWFPSLGKHIQNRHGKTTIEYRKEVGLLKTTPLSNPKIAKERSERASRHYYSHLRGKLKNKTGKNGRTSGAMRMAEMNRKGTCPVQIEQRVNDIKKKLSRSITKRDVPSGLLKAILIRYGSWNKFLKNTGRPINKSSLSAKEVSTSLKVFVSKNGYFPTREEMNNKACLPLLSYRPVVKIFGSLTNAYDAIMHKL